ncbi:hypothetical protein EV359DRAFT_86119 [Lentinula novae-zelandiae]|nr:hypothetical protein EV359DRAFT_86119 [Lentinula novae-zelandiae]
MFKGHIVFILLVFLSVASAAPAKGSSDDPSNDPSSSGNPDPNSGGSANPKPDSKPAKFIPTHHTWSFEEDPQPAVVDNGKSKLVSNNLQRIHPVEQAIRYLHVSPSSESYNVLSLTSKKTCSALSFLVDEMHAPSSAIKSQAVQVYNWSDVFRWIEHPAAKFVFSDRFTDYDRRDLLALALPIILHASLGGDDRRQFLEQTNGAPTLFSLLSSPRFHDVNHSKVTYSPSRYTGILGHPETEFRSS